MKSISLFNTPFFNSDRDVFASNWLADFDRAYERNPMAQLYKQVTDTSWSSQMIYNDEKSAWTVTLEIPGVTKANLKVDVKEGHMTLSGEKTKGLNIGKFEKFFKIPDGIDVEKSEALFEDGVLTVTLPLQAMKTGKTLEIK